MSRFSRLGSIAPIRAAAGKWIARRWREILLLLASVIIAYCGVEAAYRFYQFETLPDRLFRIASAESQNHGSSELVFDPYTGFRYAPFVQGHSGPPFNSHWRTNSHGHVSQSEYPREKPAGEYRIAVIGDSMTANTQNNVRWTELVERQLNAAPAWRSFVQDRNTRVINFGVHMLGMVQFAQMLRHHALHFGPDLIIVNFISDDLRRRLFFPVLPDATMPHPQRDELLRTYVRTNILYQIRWFRPYPEVFACTIGTLWHMRCSLPPDARLVWSQSVNFVYDERSEAVAASAAAIRDMIEIARTHDRPIIFLQQPQMDELDDTGEPEGKVLMEELRRALPEFSSVSMRPRMAALLDGKRLKDRLDLAGMTRHQIMDLPDARKPELYRWFYFPQDSHYSDYGTTLYGGEVAAWLIERAAARSITVRSVSRN